MKHVLLLLPNLALFVVLCRMAGVGLHRERPGVFLFLCAWLFFCLASMVISQAEPNDSARYAQIYFWITIAVWVVALFPLASATRILYHAPLAPLVVIVILAAGWLGLRVLDLDRGTDITHLTLAITCFGAAAAGAVFFLASLSGAALEIDKLLWRGVGGYLLAFGFGLLISALRGLGFTWLLLPLTAVWLTLAWFIAPLPDGTFNLESLALTPIVRPRATSIARKTNA